MRTLAVSRVRGTTEQISSLALGLHLLSVSAGCCCVPSSPSPSFSSRRRLHIGGRGNSQDSTAPASNPHHWILLHQPCVSFPRSQISRPRLVASASRTPRFCRTFATQQRLRVSASSRHEYGYDDPTIYALSTAPGRSAIAVVRVSGPACQDVYRALCPGMKIPAPRKAVVRKLFRPRDLTSKQVDIKDNTSQILDSGALVLYFPAPHTATGEDVLEFHVHGGPAVIRAVLAAIPLAHQSSDSTPSSVRQRPTIRYAEPGEFTRRAFLNGRLDLTQAEALGDTLSATTERQRELSIRGSSGQLAARYESWRQHLLAARGELEALIDFAEDQHFDESPSALCASVAGQVRGLRRTLGVYRSNAVRGELLRHGISVCLLGAPNAGKSSLLNRVVGREAAIVSSEAGTTRDVVEVGIDLEGFFCRVGDTAGLRRALEAQLGGGEGLGKEAVVGLVEREGMKRAKARAEESDVVLVVLSFEPDAAGVPKLHLDEEVIETAAQLVAEKDNVVVAINKADSVASSSPTSTPPDELHAQAITQTLAALPGLTRDKVVLISCKEAESTDRQTAPQTSQSATPDPGNIQAFLHAVTTQFRALTTALAPEGDADAADPSIWQASLGASERHRLLLEDCVVFLDAFLGCVEGGEEGIEDEGDVDIVVAAEHLRGAADCLAKITGKGEGSGDVEEVLGVVFEKFCVGK